MQASSNEFLHIHAHDLLSHPALRALLSQELNLAEDRACFGVVLRRLFASKLEVTVDGVLGTKSASQEDPYLTW